MVVRPLVALLAALVLAPSAAAASAPTDLHAFLLRATEAPDPTHTFPRTPAFAWNPVTGASRYEFQLSTSSRFTQNAIVWESEYVKSPVTTIPLTLPWITGASYSWYARVRAVVSGDETAWSTKYGFKMRPEQAPASLSSGVNPRPGMIRWTPVDGATAYEVVFLYDLANGEKKKIKTATTAADLREYYAFHNDVALFNPIYWRVRAVRELEGTPLNNIPVVSYGGWSPLFQTTEPALGAGTLDLEGAISRSRSTDIASLDATGGPGPHELFPGFWWSGRYSLDGYGDCPADVALLGVTCPLFHVYVYTDEDCVNRVHNSDLVGSPAYVPRLTGTLNVPDEPGQLAQAAGLYLGDASDEGTVYDAGEEKVLAAGLQDGIPTDPDNEDLPEGKEPDRRTGLWDDDWSDSRYYWTVVPAIPRITPDAKVEYHDVAFGEDSCQAGQVLPFGKTSSPATEKASGVPYASGMTSAGEIRGATTDQPRFFGRIVVAWKPAPGAQKYQVQWSRKAYPWRTAGTLKTPATAAALNLPDGVWYYRVRGLDKTLPTAAQGMTWSDPQYVRILPRTFSVVG